MNDVSDPTMADNLLEPSSLNAVQLDQLNPSATSTLSQAADGATLPSTNFGAMELYWLRFSDA